MIKGEVIERSRKGERETTNISERERERKQRVKDQKGARKKKSGEKAVDVLLTKTRAVTAVYALIGNLYFRYYRDIQHFAREYSAWKTSFVTIKNLWPKAAFHICPKFRRENDRMEKTNLYTI